MGLETILVSYQQPKDIPLPPATLPHPWGCHNIRKLIFHVMCLLDLKKHSEISLVAVDHHGSRETAFRCCGHPMSDQTATQSFDFIEQIQMTHFDLGPSKPFASTEKVKPKCFAVSMLPSTFHSANHSAC